MVTRDIMEVGGIEFKIVLTKKSRAIYCTGKNVI
jgi:hypothetical protein